MLEQENTENPVIRLLSDSNCLIQLQNKHSNCINNGLRCKNFDFAMRKEKWG